jgi:hypothetical protein
LVLKLIRALEQALSSLEHARWQMVLDRRDGRVFILYGVGHDPAISAVLLYQAVGLLVPLVGGGIAYAVIRRSLTIGASAGVRMPAIRRTR